MFEFIFGVSVLALIALANTYPVLWGYIGGVVVAVSLIGMVMSSKEKYKK